MASLPFAPCPPTDALPTEALPCDEPFPTSTEAPRDLPVLVAPRGQLSGDGQLRELMRERRDRRAETAAIWYLPPGLLEELTLTAGLAQGQEAVVAQDPAVITWLKLRFGGESATVPIAPGLLDRRANALPPPAPPALLDRS